MSLFTDLDKNGFRKKVLGEIAAFDEAYIIYSDETIFKTLSSLPEVLSADTVFSYLSVGREVDTRRFLKFCLSLGKDVALPVVLSDSKMEFALIKGLDELAEGAYGIPAPLSGAPRAEPTERDICIVPALCFDKQLCRLGRGGGYYDRFLISCRAKTIGLCRERLVFDRVPTQPHDIGVSLLITEEKSGAAKGP